MNLTCRSIVLLLAACTPLVHAGEEELDAFDQALANGQAAREGFRRCQHYVEGWLALADPATGLIPRNRQQRVWNAQDAAADNYAFMVLTTSFTDRSLFEGRMREMLATEERLTPRIDRLPDTYDFATEEFASAEADLGRILFGSSEYIKDGLLPLTEWLGPSPWGDRMLAILDDIWKHAPVDTPYGRIVSTSDEVNGEMLQVLSRVHWMTGEEKYLEWALRLGDYYLLGDHHPTRDAARLRLRDHGCEIVSGLCELYATVHHARPAKKTEYQEAVHAMLDRILEVARNEHGLFYNSVDPVAGTALSEGIADTWGYTFNGFYTVHLVDGVERYRDATVKALGCLHDHYRNYAWEGESSDGYADSIESALNLINREPVLSAAQWIDSEIRVMWAKQQDDGVIEGWHGDGNFARTTIMYCLWKTQGLSIRPWRSDVVVGAAMDGDDLCITLQAERDWNGTLRFDVPRHRVHMKLPFDWPRINQFPEWFTVRSDRSYSLRDLAGGEARSCPGIELGDGLALALEGGTTTRLRVRKEDTTPR